MGAPDPFRGTLRASLPVTILAGGTTSAALALGASLPVGLDMPAAFDGTSVKFDVSLDGGTTWKPLYDLYGVEVTVTVSTSRHIPLDPSVFWSTPMIRLRVSTQAARRDLTLMTRAF